MQNENSCERDLKPVETNWKKIKQMSEEELDELLSHEKITIVKDNEGVH